MKKRSHQIYIGSLFLITVAITAIITNYGYDYYTTSILDRLNHPLHETLKPSGFLGHGFGIIGSLLIVIGVFSYMARKRFRTFSRIGILKHWLEFHIFLCVLGSILVLFHTGFKTNGLVAVSFWSMVAIVLSGIIGRFIYIQIPRTIEGRVLSLNELNIRKVKQSEKLKTLLHLDDELINIISASTHSQDDLNSRLFISVIIKRLKAEHKQKRLLIYELKKRDVSPKIIRLILGSRKSEILLARRISWLSNMQRYLQYWHVIHLPFAFVMLFIMLIHIAVVVLFGYTWIF